jgi:ATP-dependent protease ClpP protease subunit/uncharacterized coiled-coil protein SlyX
MAIKRIKLHGYIDCSAISLDYIQQEVERCGASDAIYLDIHCDGGDVAEGLAIYDYLRQCGRELHTNIEGGCHSMAIVLLLAAPQEHRTASPNCRAVIHEVRTDAIGATAKELHAQATICEAYQANILDIYADRTGYDRTKLEEIMAEEKERTAEELLAWNFISSINSYTNLYKARKMELINKIKNAVRDINAMLGKVVNFEHKDAEGAVILITEAEDEAIEVGMAAEGVNGEKDGEFILPDGRKVKVEAGIITEIEVEEPHREEPHHTEEEFATLQRRIEKLEGKLAELTELLAAANKQLTSQYAVANRKGSPVNATKVTELTAEEQKEAIRAKLK